MPVTLKGKIFSGVLRGKPLIELYYPRLVGLLGFEPFKGTMDIRLEKKIDIRPFAEKSLEHLLLSGHRMVYAYLAHVRLHIRKNAYDCWAMRQADGVYEDDVIELIGKDCFKEKLDLKDGDEIEITFFEKPTEEKKKRIRMPVLKRKKKTKK
jgi:riboflavin kinase